MELFKLLGTIAINNSDANSAIDDTTGKAEKSEGKISKAFKKIGGAVVTYLAADKIKSFGSECVNMGSDVQEMQNKFDVVFSGMTEQVEEWAETYSRAIGRNSNTIKGYLADNQNMFVGMGMTRQQAAGLSENLVTLALDLASFNNLNETDAVNAMSKALMGETESAKTLGAVLNENTRALAMEQLGYEGKYEALTEAQKMEVNYQAILNQSQDAIGDCERSLDSYKGKQIQATSAVENLKEKIGSYLLPVMTKFQEKIGQVATWISDHLEPAVSFVQDKFEKFRTKAKEIGDYASEKLSPIIDNLKESFNKVKDALQPLIDKFIDYVTNGELVEDVTNLIKDAVDFLSEAYDKVVGFIGDLVIGFQDAVEWGTEHKTALEMVAIAVGTLTTALIAHNAQQAIKNAGGITELAQLALLQIQITGLTIAENAHTLAATVATGATTAFGAAMSFLTSPITLVIGAIGLLVAAGVLLAKHWDEIKEKATEIFQSIADWVGEKVDAIKKFFKDLADNIKKKLEEIKQFFSDAKDKIVEKFQDIGSWFSDRVSDIKNAFSNIGSWFGEKFGEAWQAIKDKFASWGEFWSDLWTKVKNKFSDIGSSIGSAISDTVKSGINGVLGTIENVINKGIGLINGAINLANKLPGVSVSNLDSISLPRLAKGGVLEKGQVGVLEGNGAEAVVPLENNKKWIAAVARDMQGAIYPQSSSSADIEKTIAALNQTIQELPSAIFNAIASGNIKFDVGNREFARLVKAVNNA